jgi:type VI secretion system protein ImpH
MAAPAGQPLDSLTGMQDLRTRFASYEFYAALRRIECLHPDLPRLGKGARASDDPVRLGQVPSLTFTPTMFADAQIREDGRLWLGGAFFGLFGPNGPLPLHLTEYAHDRSHNFRDHTLARYADIFHHRLHCLFYRGWADAQPTVQHDRPVTDRFRMYVGALVGIGQKSLRDRDEMPDAAKLFHGGRLASQVRNPEGLRVLLQDFFGEAVEIREFQGEWMTLQPDDRLRLGGPRNCATLGESCTLGPRVWGAQSRFQVVLGAMTVDRFRRFLPGHPALSQLNAIVRNYVGFEFEYDLRLLVEREEVPGIALGQGARLGWDSWLGAPHRLRDADDVVLTQIDRYQETRSN